MILQNNADSENWVVVNSDKETKRAPGVCFNIPPPDPEGTAHVNRLAKDLDDLKRKRSDTEDKLRNRYNELNQMKQPYENKQSSLLNQSAAPDLTVLDRSNLFLLPASLLRFLTILCPFAGYSLASAKDDPWSKELLSKLDKIHGDLGEAEKKIITQLRVPINQSAPNKDITNRLRDHETMNKHLQKIGAEKDSVQQECESFLSKKPADASSSQLPNKLNNVKNKYKGVTSLADQYQNKAKSQLELENSIEKVDDALKKIESDLADDSVIPDSPNAMQQRKTELQ
eukprot:g47045.t1